MGKNGAGMKKTNKVMLVDTMAPAEVRVAVTADGRLDDFFLERKAHDLAPWNIYRGRVKDIEHNLQAAFVDFGEEKHGFLHASDVIPPDGGYRDILAADSTPAAKSGTRRRRLPIQEMLHRGDEVLSKSRRTKSVGRERRSQPT